MWVPVVELAVGTPTTIHCDVSAAGGSAVTGAASDTIRTIHATRPAILATVLGSFTFSIVTG